MRLLWLLLTALLLTPVAVQAQARRHIVVILDTSKSMIKNDQKRLATLSTAMLFDLARPDLASGDTFEVIPFQSGGQQWTDSSEPCEDRAGAVIPAIRGSSSAAAGADLADKLRRAPYDANWTYFYPPLCTAVKRLEGREGQKVIVVVTDGKSDRSDLDQSLIRQKLVPKMLDQSIQLQVLAFGRAEGAAASAFFQPIVNSGGASLGQVFEDLSGDLLLENMIEIFGRCCAYTSEIVRGNRLQLRGRVIPENAAVVAFWKTAGAKPGFEFPSEPKPGLANELRTASEAGASYAVRWLTAPIPEAPVEIQLASPNAIVAILRPPEIELEWTDLSPFETLATQNDLCREVAVKLRGGSGEEPPDDIAVSFRVHGPDRDSGRNYVSDWEAASGGALNADRDARIYRVCPVFKDTFPEGSDFYLGRLEARAMRGEVVLETLTGVEGMAATVRPLLRIRSTPSKAGADRQSLGRSEVGCANFSLVLEPWERFEARAGRGEPFRLTAALDPKLDLGSGPLAGASVRLDGRPVRFKEPGRALWEAQLDADLIARLKRAANADAPEFPLKVCVETGRPTEGGTAGVELHFSLAEPPYRDMPLGALSDPFTIELEVAAPDFWQRYWSLLTLLLLLLLLALLAWYTRYRLTLPPDFRMAPAGAPGGPFLPQPLGEAPLFRKLAGLDSELPFETPGSPAPLGWVRPLGRDLYAFRPPQGAHGLQQEDGGGWKDAPTDGETYTIEARRSYRYQGPGGEMRTFRAEFEQ
ncbi:MAG: hypothetical protein GC160_07825 [Acidobacteria bacterium]|nr:hypothetical protein [Acidobacteriota bacterium]